MNPSLWLETIEKQDYETLDHDYTTEVLIVGGGLTGISCAHELAKAGKKVVIVDSNELLHGTTGFTTSKLTVQHGLIYDKLMSKLGIDAAKAYYGSNSKAIAHVKQNCAEYGIDCDMYEAPASIYTNSVRYVRKLEKEYEAAQKIGIESKLTEELPVPYYIKKALTYTNQVEFNVVKYLSALIKEIEKNGGRIYEHTQVVKVKESSHGCEATLLSGHTIYADDVIIASHYPCHQSLDFYFTKLMPTFSYVMAFKTKDTIPHHMMISAEDPVRSLRKVTYNGEELLLVAGESHDAIKTKNKAQHFDNLHEYTDYYFHIEKEYFRFSTMDFDTVDQLPLIGRVNRKKTHVYLATGYGKWGMTKGVLASLILSDLILKGENEYEELYTPQRFTRMLNGKFISYNLEQPFKFLKSKSLSTEPLSDLPVGEQKMISLKGKKMGAFKDETGKLHLVDVVCPHMKCTLRFNNAEKTYDCMCHGSRFRYDGKYLDGPSKRNLDQYDLGRIVEEKAPLKPKVTDTTTTL